MELSLNPYGLKIKMTKSQFTMHIMEGSVHDLDAALKEATRHAFMETPANQKLVSVELVETVLDKEDDVISFTFEVTRSYYDN